MATRKAATGSQNDDDMMRITVRMRRKVLRKLEKMAEDDKRSISAEVLWLIDAAINIAETTSERRGMS